MGKVPLLGPCDPISTHQVKSVSAPAPCARFNDAVDNNEAVEMVDNNKNDEIKDDNDDQIIPPHPSKNPPLTSAPRDPSKTRPPVSKDNTGGRYALDGDY